MSELPFAVDRRDELKGQSVTHALLIGVSHYDHLSSLGAGAHTALRMLEWLRRSDLSRTLMAPLATATILLSPSESEKAIVGDLMENDRWSLASRDNITQAQKRLHKLVFETEIGLTRQDEETGAGMAIYYFGGHGADMFRDDPIGMASDANTKVRPWFGAFDHQEFREYLTRIEDDGLSAASSHRTRCLFLYDCCRTRSVDTDFQQLISPVFGSRLEQPVDVRPYRALAAATEGFPAWEPSVPINISPAYDVPLSFFGHAVLRAFEWSQDFSRHPQMTWQTNVLGLENDVRRAMTELARKDKNGGNIPGQPQMKGSGPSFAVAISENPPNVNVLIRCIPEKNHKTTRVLIDQRFAAGYQKQRELPPWTNHPEAFIFNPGMFKIDAVTLSGSHECTIVLKPVLTEWEWIITDDEIAVHDPAN